MNRIYFPVPKGCVSIEVEFDSERNILITKLSPKSIHDEYNEITNQMERCAGIGDMAVMWNDGLEHMAIISVLKDWEATDNGMVYKAANGEEYDNAIKFRDDRQYYDIIEFKNRKNEKQ